MTRRVALWAGLVITAENDWFDVGRPQVAMHRNCHLPLFLVFVALNIYNFITTITISTQSYTCVF